MKNLSVKANISIRQAMKALEKTAEKCLLVVDDNDRLLGTLTDGDLRRSILSGEKFSAGISSSYNDNPIVLEFGKYDSVQAKKLLVEQKLTLVPVVDKSHIVVDYITFSTLGSNKVEDLQVEVPVIIMAGGKGTRMEPFTNILPKPLVPIHDKPIIEHIVERFTAIGCHDFFITVNYKSKIMKAFFEELAPDYNVHFVDEKEPLGTAGSLGFLSDNFTNPFFVSNCDIIIKTDLRKLYDFHLKGGYDVTLVASMKEYIIPYGTCELNKEGHLSHINEKPSYDFLVNTGLYVLNPEVLKYIPENTFYHITHLIEDLKNEGKTIGVFPIDDSSWIDIGQWAEYHKAIKQL